MKSTIIGTKYTKFKNDSGQWVETLRLYVTHKLPPNTDYSHYDGIGCSEVKCPVSFADELVVGLVCDLDYDADGNLLEIVVD